MTKLFLRHFVSYFNPFLAHIFIGQHFTKCCSNNCSNFYDHMKRQHFEDTSSSSSPWCQTSNPSSWPSRSSWPSCSSSWPSSWSSSSQSSWPSWSSSPGHHPNQPDEAVRGPQPAIPIRIVESILPQSWTGGCKTHSWNGRIGKVLASRVKKRKRDENILFQEDKKTRGWKLTTGREDRKSFCHQKGWNEKKAFPLPN